MYLSFEETSINLFGIRIDEPVATITDLMVSAVCFYAYFRLARHKNQTLTIQYFQYYFLAMGIATTFGGLIGHGFLYLFSFTWKLPGWLISMISIALLERASIEYARPHITNQKIFKFFAWLNIIELITFIILTFSTLNFFFVEIHSAYGLLVVTAGFHSFVYYKSKSEASRLTLIGVGISALAALFFMNEWVIHKWLNHIDISHIIMTIAAWFFYLAGKQIADHTINKKSRTKVAA